ncbi:hypothetical protein GGF32_007429 [Allomyces javanicus]|nr:hypothetical protein GGF32_007429 [Allomyces javanicus]
MFENLQCATVDGIKWVDTPGLADVKQREKAAKGITMALKEPGRYRFIFVVTEKAGHADPMDVATIATVLNAIDKEKIPFGVIINKVSSKVLKRASCNPADREKLALSINSGFYQTEHFFMAQKVDSAFDQDNYICPDWFVAPIKAFIAKVPSVEIRPEMVDDVDGQNLDNVAQMIKKMVSKMLDQQKAQLDAMQKQHECTLEEMRRQNEQNRVLVEQSRIEAQERFEAAERERRAADERFHQAQLALIEQANAKEAELFQMRIELDQSRLEAQNAADREIDAKIRLLKIEQNNDRDDSIGGVILRGIGKFVEPIFSGLFD